MVFERRNYDVINFERIKPYVWEKKSITGSGSHHLKSFIDGCMREMKA